MMPGVGFFETILLVLVAVVVIGPKDLPLMMRKFGRFTGKMRAMAFEFKQGFDELGRQAELEELRKEVADLKKHTGLEDIEKDFNEDANRLQNDVNQAMAPLPAPTPAHPAAAGAIAANGAAAAHSDSSKPEAAPYAGLSADHPGYDAGNDFHIHGSSPQPDAIPAKPAPDEILTGPLPHELPHEVEQGEPPHDSSRRSAVKQDTPA
jgi:sec-independent protein translocase protein TatB